MRFGLNRSRITASVGLWVAATLITSILICAAVIAMHSANQRALREATDVIGDLREARLNLIRGTVDLRISMLSPDIGRREQALAQLQQTKRAFDAIHAASPADAQALDIEFENFIGALNRTLIDGDDPRVLAGMRAAYQALDDRLVRIDAAKLRAVDELAADQDRIFQLVLTAAILLMGAISAAAVWSARQRQLADASLRDSEERFRLMFDRSPLPKALVGPQGNVIALNQTFTMIFGYTQAEIPTLDEWRRRAYPPEADRDEISARIAKHMKTAQMEGFAEPEEITIVDKDGVRRDMLISAMPLEGGILASFTDITERKRAERVMRKAMARSDAARVEAESIRARLEAALGAMSDAVCIADTEGRFIHFNNAFLRFHHIDERLACPPRQSEFITLVELLDEDGAPLPPERRPLARALAGEVNSDLEFRVRRTDTGKTWIGRYTTAPIRDRDDTIVGAVVSARDITQRKADEKRLRESEIQLAQSQKMEAVGQLTGGVAHDFNNLLAVVIGNLELYRSEGPGAPDAEEMLSTALRAANRGADLTRRLLAFSRRQTLQPRRIDLNAMVDGLHGLLVRTLGANISIEIKLSPDVGGVIADPAQLESALLNLAVNARDAMPGGGRLTVATRIVELDDEYARSRTDVVPGVYESVSVTDSGTGMPADVAARAFEPFFTTKDVGKGSGLGLSMVYGFAKQSGGHAAIYSEPGHGTTVTIYLPRAQRDTRGAVDTADAPALTPGGGETVLVVEDDPDICKLIRAHLRALHYQVEIASDGPKAISSLAGGLAPAALLTDIMMPGGMDGVKVAHAAREMRPDLPIIYMSGYADGGDAREQIVADGAPFLQKPFTKAQLADAMARVLDKQTAAR